MAGKRLALAASGREGGLAVETEKLKARKMQKKTRRVPQVGCMLCWAMAECPVRYGKRCYGHNLPGTVLRDGMLFFTAFNSPGTNLSQNQ